MYQITNQFLSKEWIMEKWDAGFYITAAAGASARLACFSPCPVLCRGFADGSRYAIFTHAQHVWLS